MKATRLTKLQEGPIPDKEKLLTTWTKEQTHKHNPLGTGNITAKAKFAHDVEQKDQT